MASKRQVRRKSCERKVKYETAKDANANIRIGLIVYKCKFCGKYHVGHPPRKAKQSLMDKGWRSE